MTAATPHRIGRRPILSLPAFRKPVAASQAEQMPHAPVEPAVLALPRLLSEAEHAAALADLAAILGCGIADLPAVFAGLSPRPLKKGIHEDVLERFPAADVEALGRWLKSWTGHPAYLHRMAHGGPRHGLEGQVDGAVALNEKRRAVWMQGQLMAPA